MSITPPYFGLIRLTVLPEEAPSMHMVWALYPRPAANVLPSGVAAILSAPSVLPVSDIFPLCLPVQVSQMRMVLPPPTASLALSTDQTMLDGPRLPIFSVRRTRPDAADQMWM